MSKRLAYLAVTAATVVVLSAPAQAAAEPIEVGHIPECTEGVPAAVAIPAGAPALALDVRVLLDGVSGDPRRRRDAEGEGVVLRRSASTSSRASSR